ncbi:MAG: family 78 glycoside hydrolase catalytic domain [Clostridia bacterium]|nr:family 78 glycoside hydrolase catalytic domain [Clostridia bacterium]
MTHRELFADARWITPPSPHDAALFRKSFHVRDADGARITICGLGYFILYINGKRVGNDEFVPPVSDYHARPDMTLSYPLNDTQSHRIYVMRYDVSDYLRPGENVLGVAVGGGFYHQTRRIAEGRMSYGNIKLCFRLQLPDGEVLSDGTVQCSPGYFKACNLFHGETQDFTHFRRDWHIPDKLPLRWRRAACVEPPQSEYYVADCPTDRIAEILKPELVRDHGSYSVYRVARNITGYPVVFCEKPGETVEIECAENLTDDGDLDYRSVGFGRQRQRAAFVTDKETMYHPMFTWFGFRYFSLTNNAKPAEVRVIHAHVPVRSSFACGNDVLNWLHEAFIHTQQCNMHGSIPSDCPHRERLGYTGDGQLTCDAVLTQFDAASFYRKWIADIEDCQDVETGHVQHTAPYGGGGGGPAGWGGAMIVVPYTYYRHTGDRTLLRRVYPKMLHFVRYMESRCENGLIVREEKDGWCLGEWCTPQRVAIPEPFVNTTLYISQLRMLVFCAEALGEDATRLRELIRVHRQSVDDAYEKDGVYCGGIQGADAFALDCGLGDARTLSHLVARYTALGEFDTGIFGTPILLRVLFENGYHDLAYSVWSNTKDGSFDAMRRGGATTLWENWNGEASHNHPMFGACTVFFFRYLLGVRQTETDCGKKSFVLSPVFPRALAYAEGSMETAGGTLAVGWKRKVGGVELTADVCEGISVKLCCEDFCKDLPAGKHTFTIRA